MATDRIFTANVVLARNRGGEVTEFKIGDVVPKWAADRIGEHVSQGTTRAADAPEAEEARDVITEVPETPAEPVVTEVEEDEEDSYTTWTKAELKDEAKARGIEGFSGMNKEELVAALEEDDKE